eukprot:GFYU01003481.1.p1 GENE.GFYU01003481.1~~GFYU01003481.1.p1  ORF type:complete len:783 (+),score=72.84 GFYU01003481.1:150-2498(+)
MKKLPMLGHRMSEPRQGRIGVTSCAWLGSQGSLLCWLPLVCTVLSMVGCTDTACALTDHTGHSTARAVETSIHVVEAAADSVAALQGSDAPTYTAAVVEHGVIGSTVAGVVSRSDAVRTMFENIRVLEQHIVEAKARDPTTAIIVFPEYGIYTPQLPEPAYMRPYCEYIPEVENGNPIIHPNSDGCDFDTDNTHPQHDGDWMDAHTATSSYGAVLRRMSCLAMQYSITIVFNMCDYQRAPPATTNDPTDASSSAPAAAFALYNTQVALSETGQLLAKYHKLNLYGEGEYAQPVGPDTVYFDTSFGVRFGMFICYDLMFNAPSRVMAGMLGVRDFVFSTRWVNFFPMWTSVQFQQGWSQSLGVNLLASSSVDVRRPVTASGCGIYHKGVALVSTFNTDEGPHSTSLDMLLVSRVPRLNVATETRDAIFSTQPRASTRTYQREEPPVSKVMSSVSGRGRDTVASNRGHVNAGDRITSTPRQATRVSWLLEGDEVGGPNTGTTATPAVNVFGAVPRVKELSLSDSHADTAGGGTASVGHGMGSKGANVAAIQTVPITISPRWEVQTIRATSASGNVSCVATFNATVNPAVSTTWANNWTESDVKFLLAAVDGPYQALARVQVCILLPCSEASCTKLSQPVTTANGAFLHGNALFTEILVEARFHADDSRFFAMPLAVQDDGVLLPSSVSRDFACSSTLQSDGRRSASGVVHHNTKSDPHGVDGERAVCGGEVSANEGAMRGEDSSLSRPQSCTCRLMSEGIEAEANRMQRRAFSLLSYGIVGRDL